MKETYPTQFWKNVNVVFLVIVAVMYLAFDLYEGWGHVRKSETVNWHNSLFMLLAWTVWELYMAVWKTSEAKLKESRDYWMERANEAERTLNKGK